jgi:hypothetical protein
MVIPPLGTGRLRSTSEERAVFLRLLPFGLIALALVAAFVGSRSWLWHRDARDDAQVACQKHGGSESMCEQRIEARDEPCWEKSYRPPRRNQQWGYDAEGYRRCVLDQK